MTTAWRDEPQADTATRRAALYRHAVHHATDLGVPLVADEYATYFADTYAPEPWSPDHRTELRAWLRQRQGLRP